MKVRDIKGETARKIVETALKRGYKATVVGNNTKSKVEKMLLKNATVFRLTKPGMNEFEMLEDLMEIDGKHFPVPGLHTGIVTDETILTPFWNCILVTDPTIKKKDTEEVEESSLATKA